MATRFVFWQNINSIHQSAFLRALSDTHEVVLVTTDACTGREHMGWHEPELPGVRRVHMQDGGWEVLLQREAGIDVCHVFAGLHAFPGVHAAFRRAVELRCRIGIYSEPLVRLGPLGWLKDLRGRFDSHRYGDAIAFVLCIGEEAKRQFADWGFPCRKLHSWAYVTEDKGLPVGGTSADAPLRAVFPASLIPRKGPDILLRALQMMRHRGCIHVDAFSVEPDRMDAWQKDLQAKADRSGGMSVLPYIDNADLLRRLPTYDLMVLPSRHDGWGAAVNEALMAGVPALVSDRCGAATLLKGRPSLGQVVPPEPALLAASLDAFVERGRVSPEARSSIRAWALEHISGSAMARHFLNIAGVSDSPMRMPASAPWEHSDKPIEKHSRAAMA